MKYNGCWETGVCENVPRVLPVFFSAKSVVFRRIHGDKRANIGTI
jgi:hypothetical protein